MNETENSFLIFLMNFSKKTHTAPAWKGNEVVPQRSGGMSVAEPWNAGWKDSSPDILIDNQK